MSKTTHYLNTPRPSINVAAAEHFDQKFFDTLAKLGLNVVLVSFKAGLDSPIWDHPGIEENLLRELKSVHAGQFDSSAYDEGVITHFFHVSDLAKAMQQLKASLEARGLLKITTILHAETPQELRQWYPPTADLLKKE